MNDYVLLVVSSIIAVPMAYLFGYKLRRLVPPNRRFPIGFTVSLIVLTLALVLSLEFHMFRLVQSVATAIAIGFPLGMAGPPFNEPKRENVQSK